VVWFENAITNKVGFIWKRKHILNVAVKKITYAIYSRTLYTVAICVSVPTTITLNFVTLYL